MAVERGLQDLSSLSLSTLSALVLGKRLEKDDSVRVSPEWGLAIQIGGAHV